MDGMLLAVVVMLAMALGFVVAWWVRRRAVEEGRAEVLRLGQELNTLRTETSGLGERLARSETQLEAHVALKEVLEEKEGELRALVKVRDASIAQGEALAQVERQLKGQKIEVRTRSDELESTNEKLRELGEALVRAETQLATKESPHKKMSEALNIVQLEVHQLRDERDTLLVKAETLDQVQQRLADQTEALKTRDDQVRQGRDRAEDLSTRLGRVEAQQTATETARAKLDDALVRTESENRGLKGEREASLVQAETLEQTARQLSDHKVALQTREEELLGARERTQTLTERVTRAEAELEARDATLRKMAMDMEQAQTDIGVLKGGHEASIAQGAALEQMDRQLEHHRATLKTRDEALSDSRRSVRELIEQLTRAETKLKAQETAHIEKLAEISGLKAEMLSKFNLLAGQVLEAKGKTISEQSQQRLELILKPFQEQLKGFETRVEGIHRDELQGQAALKEQIVALTAMNKAMNDEAKRLSQALKGDNQVQGAWGEMILERVLEQSGLRKGHEYEVQVSLMDDEGQRRRPDVVIRLPDKKDMVVDAKVSLLDYHAYVNSESDAARDAALKRHVVAVRRHIDGLSEKNYPGLRGLRTVDFVLLFMPIEAAFIAAAQADMGLFEYALNKRIVVVTPSTLLATVRTVAHVWRMERQTQNVQEIVGRAGKIVDKARLVVAAFDDADKHFGKAQLSLSQARERLSTGSGNLVRQVHSLEQLGAQPRTSFSESTKAEAGCLDVVPDAVGLLPVSDAP